MRLGRFALLFGLALLTVIQGYSQDPTFEWVARAGGAAAFSGGYGIAHDAAGNVYVAGRFTGTVDFDPGAGTTNLTSAGALDVYVTKTDAAGNLVWAKRVGGTLDDYSFDMSADEGGSVYVTGAFSGTADFDPGPGTFNLSSAGLFDDIFVLKLDTNGDLAWAKKMGGADFDFGRSITVSSAGNVFTTGNFRGTVDFDPGSGTSFLTSASGGNDIFISKLDASGNFVWARRMGGTSSDIGYAITVDGAENVFTTGSFSTTADFDPGAAVFNLVDAGNGDIFISKLNASGNFVWAKGIGGTSSDVGYDIQLNFSGDVYTTGYFEATADFDPGAGIANLVSAGFNDSFISKLDPSGNYIWAKGMGGVSDEESNSLALDGFGNVYTTGSFESTVDFDPGAGTFPITPVGSADAFVVKLNTSGDFVWAEAMLGAGSAFPNGIDVDNFGSVYTTGYFNGTVDFDPGAGVSNGTAVGSNDTYIHKMTQDLPPPTITSFAPSNGPVGTTVILTGTNFSPTLLANTVYFGATRATVTGATPTQLTVTVPIGSTFQPISVTVVGLTGYSKEPFLVTFPDGGVIGACAFDAKVDFTTGVNPKSVAIGDVDGDGKADLVVANFNSNTISVFRNIGVAGSVTAGSLGTKVDFASGTQPIHVTMGDLDGDGKLDIAVTNFGGGTISVFRNTSVSGTINASSFATKVDFTTGVQPQSIAMADLDSDGKLDMINSNFSGSTFSAHRNTSTPGLINASSFEAPVTFSTGGGPTGNLLSDLDGDGKVDVVTANQTGNTVSVFRNTSTVGSFSASTFATPVAFTTGASPISIAAGDLDGDDKAELVVANTGSNTVSVFRNTTTSGAITIGSFAAKVDFTTGSSPISVSIDDIDGEGNPDIAVANSASSNISVLRNEMTGPISTTSFAAKVDFVTGSTPWARIGDLDGDGKPDLAVTGGGSVSVLRNTVSSLPPPTITNISPANGPVGTMVTITGTNFSAASLLNNTVKFNGVTATVLAASSTSITTVVPVGATTGTISVTVGCSTATSSGTFNVYCVPATERDALIALYNATDGANWDDNTGWLSADVSTWFGVTVSGCNVVDIALPGNNLVGPLPPEIGDLPLLEGLDLGANQLSGNIPPEIGNLSNLIALNLSINQLDGSVPFELSYLSNLQVLGLAFNTLSGNLPSDLMFLNNLTDVALNNNMFTGDLPLIGGTTANLNTLLAQFNQFADLPDLNSYSSLGFVNVASNRLTFDDLEPYMGLSNFFYDPQAQVPPGGIISFIPGGTLSIPFSTGGTANSYQWYKDNVAIPGATASSLSIPGATAAEVGFYKVRITSSIVPLLVLESMSYTVITDPCASSTPTSGDLDTSFAPLINAPSYYSQPAQQTSGKILVGTDYTIINSIVTSGILRFNTDGSLDNTFAPNSYGPYFIRLPDDRILAATNGNLELLDADGNPDAGFTNPSYYNATIYALALQSDGKILVSVNEDGNLHLDRLNSDGTLDASFSAPLGIEVTSIRVQTDDHIVIGGYFVDGIMRLDPTGAVDPTFNATASDFVTDVAIQSDGKIIVVGYFNYVNDIPRRGVARLESDGSLDPTFVALGITDPFESSNYFTRIAIQPDNKIILAGVFGTINGADRKNLVRLNPDGTVDCPFDPGLSTDDTIGGLALQSDEKILISGTFTDYDGTQRFGLARVNNINAVLPPTIISFNPASGPVGATVTITGTNFSSTPANNIVHFGATQANVTAATATQLTVTVPVGASHQPITVSVGGLSAHAPRPFILTFTGGGTLDNCSFAPAFTVGATSGFTRAALADIDGDGKSDLLIPNSTADLFSIRRNTSTPGTLGATSFAAPIDIAAGETPFGIAVGDLDGDGKRDIAVINYLLQKLSLYKNQSSSGTISLAPKVDITIPDFGHDVSIGDIDGDGKLDLIITSSLVGLTVYRNIGTPGVIDASTFAAGVNFGTGPNPNPFVLGDIDGDGKLDAAVPNANAYTVSLLRNTSTPGAVSFAAQVVLTTAAGSPPAGGGAVYTVLGDLDGDAKLDLVVANNTVNTTSIFRNTSTAGNLSFDPRFDLANTDPSNTPAVSDLDGDGKIELIRDRGNTVIEVFKNVSTPGIIDAASFNAPISFIRAGSSHILLGDVDGDGRNDMITTSATIQAFHNLIGTISPPTISGFTPSTGTVSSSVTITGTNFLTQFATSVNFNGTNAAIIDLQPTSIIVGVPAGATTGPIQVIVGCNTVNSSTNFLVCTPPASPGAVPGSRCGTGTVTISATGTTDGNYRWYTVSSGGTAIAGEVNSSYTTPVITATTTYYVAINNGICESATRTSVDATIITPPTAPSTSGAANCTASALTLTASGGINGQYRWYTAATGGTALAGEVNDTYTTPILTTSTTYHVAIDDGTCESARTPVTASINTVTKPILVTSNCTATGALLAGPTGFTSYAWSNGETTQQITVTVAGSYTLVVTASTGCVSPPSDPTIFNPFFCNQAPTITPTSVTTTVAGTVTINITSLANDLDNNIDLSTLQVLVAPTSGANAFFNANSELVVDYTDVVFAGTDQLTIQVCDVAGACGQEIITIEVAGEITVYNALSPNGDGKNDALFIQYIDALPDTKSNKLTIFNRWGSVVFEAADYDNINNVFKGIGNNGSELPTGTYYYTLEFMSGAPKRTGFISLRR